MEERVCKYCFKRFPCGKSLGGHIRTHMMSENSLQSNEEKRMNANASVNAMFKFDEGRKRKRLDLGSSGGGSGGDDGNLIYGLRENPKKTTRFVHSNAAATVQMEKFCKECGKGFPSLKALCGHMACHSEKDKGANRIESVSGVREKQKLVMDSQSDTEASVQTDSRRSRRMKFKNLSGGDNKSSSSLHWGNCSSSVSEVEQEQEDVARCLMLLSRDSTYKGRFPLVTESSDNNSMVVEEKSPSVDTKFAVMNRGKNIVGDKNNGFELAEKKFDKDGKMKSGEIGYVSDNSDSGYFTYGPKKVESDDSSDAFFRNDAKSSKVGYFSSFEDHDFESNKKIMSRGRNKNSAEFKKVVMDDSRKRQNIVESYSKKTKNGYNNDEVYESLKIDRESYSEDSAYESDENSSDSDSYPAPKAQSNRNMNGKTNKKSSCKGKKKMKSKKSKEHECPICNKIFKSGQALGGHKRSHFIGGNDDNTLVIRPAAGAHAAPAPPAVVAANPSLFDLNLPAPDDE